MDLVTVIVPVYNVEKYLNRCVESIRNQTYTNLEIILVDDGSPDNCPKMCDEIQKTDNRVKVIHKQNGGLGFARNSGLEKTTGKYVTFIDSDDWINEKHIENLLSAIRKEDADLVIGSYTSVNNSGNEKIAKSKETKVFSGLEDIENNLTLPLIGADVLASSDVEMESSCCMNLYKMDIVNKYNLSFVSEKYAVAEDLYFNIDFFMHSEKILIIDEKGYYYYENLNSISRKYDPNRFIRTINFFDLVKEKIREYNLENKVGFRAERSFLMKIRVAVRHIVISDLPTKRKLDEIKAIVNNKTIEKVLKTYPIEKYSSAFRVFYYLVKNKNVVGVYCLTKIREVIKNKKLFKKSTERLGLTT